MASVILSALHMEILTAEHIVNGSVMLLESAEDTPFDILDASNELAFFLARAIMDDVLAPLNLEEIAHGLITYSCASCWEGDSQVLGGSTGWNVEDAKDKIQKLLEEYESGGVINEACQCIRDLAHAFFKNELQECFNEGLIIINQMTTGFNGIKDGLDDLARDILSAEDKFKFYLEHARGRGCSCHE
ncbi:UNVERIFIED_CONTAM: ma3 domain-containing translation regulatory factor 1 [Sesamum latifolium]|uniref:Ma3 domain-containing translation regulatory factor 1 n=1 Tax=Sesamum latifolium TaxID=2727402 RepID=A0AAW2UZY5_9LAMI